MTETNDNEIVCPNGTPESKILNAAIFSWAGYIYQGVCALCVALERLISDKNLGSSYYLNIEGYEDFAILDSDKHILSFHQCKNYKEPKDLTEEFKKMEDKRWYWNQKGICDIGTPLYLHAPCTFDVSHSVTNYFYKYSTIEPTGENLYAMLDDLIVEFSKKFKNFPGSTQRKRNKLLLLIEEQVIWIDKLNKEQEQSPNKSSLQQLSVENSIPFSKILEILVQPEEDYTLEDKIRTSCFYLVMYLMDFAEEETVEDKNKIERFLNAFNELGLWQKRDFIRRIFPDIDIENDPNAVAEISNSPRFMTFFDVLTLTEEELDLDNMHWRQNGVVQSPSTSYGKGVRNLRRFCTNIVRNKNVPAELLRDYSWIVADVENSVDDILQEAKFIKDVTETNYYKITKTRKVGIHTIEDKNNE